VPPPDGVFEFHKWWILENDMISGIIMHRGKLDADDLIPKLLPFIKAGDTVLDIGAFIGDHTIAYAQAVGEQGKVIAYEPNPLAFACLEHNLQNYPNVVCEKRAVGDRTQFVPLSIDPTHAGGAYISQFNAKSEPVPVTMVALDETLDSERMDFAKIDVEGYELQALQGMANLIERHHPILAMEINLEALTRQGTTPQEIFEWLIGHGYEKSQVVLHYTDQLYDIVAQPAGAKEVKAETTPPIAAATEEPPSQASPLTPFGEVCAMIDMIKTFAAKNRSNRLQVIKQLSQAKLLPVTYRPRKRKWKKSSSVSQ
jgi:FkbM family methyltransferase